MIEQTFGPPAEWPHQDLIAFSEEFDAWLAAAAYRCGVFPMPLTNSGFHGEMGWWSPVHRGVLPLAGLKVSRSLRQSVRRYATTVDEAFPRVLAACADPNRDGGWINDAIARVYLELHDQGLAHSIEAWDADGRLAGGLYGVSVNGLFAGESMFHDPGYGRDASKVALVRLVAELLDGGCALLDIQWVTPHLARLGAVEIDRADYLTLLEDALARPAMAWPRGARQTGAELLARFRPSG
ncbi:MAG: leucyl/phenylalanyl-tRNA--protein transferase [Propionibacteriaceae bacterium]|nr:leucyl/phenylalanyl-tRNA--protein transferase [Propionibacteriaceae bacterium]